MGRRSRTAVVVHWAGLLAGWLAVTAARAAMPDAWVEYYTLYGTNTIYLFNTGTKEIRQVYRCGNINPTQAAFSLDGKRMAFLRKLSGDTGSVLVVNNDGTGVRRVCATFARTTQHYNGTSTISWTELGLFWCENDNRIYWANPETGQSKVLGTLATNTTGNLFSVSRDGRRAYLRTDHNTAAGVGGLFFEVDAAVSGIVNERPFPDPLWDHGATMLSDGSGALWVVWNCSAYGNPPGCAYHQRFAVRDFANMTQFTMVVPPDPDTTQLSGPAGGPYYSPSSPDHILYRRGGWDDVNCVIFNYKTGEWIDATPRPIAPGGPIDSMPRLSLQGGFWLGALPNPHDSTPYISLNKSTVSFTAQSAAAPETVTVTNTGSGTLGAVAVSESPSAVWLTVTGSGAGNTQRLVVRVDTAGLARGEYQCVVSVSGGTAPNTATFTVRLSVGSSLLPPSGLSFTLNGQTWTELDAVIRWTDNTTTEGGFVVERRASGGAFAAVASPAANSVSFTDTTVARGTTYDYRVRAFAGADSSAWSETLAVAVPVYPIVVTSPSQGENWELGQQYHIRWTASGVTTVQIDYTVDDGDNWLAITSTGGISQGGQGWGDYAWTVPVSAGAQPSVRIRVAEYQNIGTANFSGTIGFVSSSAVRAARTAELRYGVAARSEAGAVTLVYRVAPGQRARIVVHDMQGREVMRLERPSDAGSVTLGAADHLAGSLYVARLFGVGRDGLQVTGTCVVPRAQ